MTIPEYLWRTKSIRRTDDDRKTYDCTHIDCIYTNLEEAVAEAYRRFQDPMNLEVSISKEPMSERYRTMYAAAEQHGTIGGTNG